MEFTFLPTQLLFHPSRLSTICSPYGELKCRFITGQVSKANSVTMQNIRIVQISVTLAVRQRLRSIADGKSWFQAQTKMAEYAIVIVTHDQYIPRGSSREIVF